MSEVMREEFEKWADSCGMDLYRAERNLRTDDGIRLGKGAYLCNETRFSWSAWEEATLKAYGDCHRAGFDSGMKAVHEFDEARIDRIASSHGDGEHYGELK